MSRLRADKLVNRGALGAPELTYGASIPVGYGLTGAGNINITGVATAGNSLLVLMLFVLLLQMLTIHS